MEEEKKENPFLAFVGKNVGFIAAGCALVAIAFLFAPMLSVETKLDGVKSYFDLNLAGWFGYAGAWTAILTLCVLGLAAISCFVGSFLKGKPHAIVLTVGGLFGVVAVCLLALQREFFSGLCAGEVENYHDCSISWGCGMAIFFAVFSGVLSLSEGYHDHPVSVRSIAEDGILIAMSFALNFLKIPLGATGGSINFQMLPLMVIALRRGPAEGLLCGGVVYGLLTCLIDGYGFACFPFDYFVGFGSVAIMGFFRPIVFQKEAKNYAWQGLLCLLAGGVLTTAIRFLGSSISSVVVYGYNFADAAIYNAVYIPVSGACATAVLMALYGPLQKIQKRYPSL